MFASSSKHILNTSLRRSQTCSGSGSQKYLRELRNFLSAHNTGKRCAHQQAQTKWTTKPPRTRARPWAHGPSSADTGLQSQFYNMSPLSRYNAQIQDLCRRGRYNEALELCTKMKQEGVRPDSVTYKHLLRAFSDEKMHPEAWAVLKDMQAMGIEPDQEAYNIVLNGLKGEHSSKLFALFSLMNEHGMVNGTTYDAIIGYYIDGDNLDMSLHKLAEMNDQGMNPGLVTAQRLIVFVAEQGYPRLALDLAIAFESSSLRRIETETWIGLLAACADNLYADGVQHCWDKLTNDLKATIHEGLCITVLHTAARHGLPALAASVLHEIESLKVPLREYHFAPVLEAFAVNGQVKEAFRILDLIRQSGNKPTLETAQPLRQTIQTDPDALDNAYSLLEELVAENQKVDIVAANIVIEGAVSMSDIQRAIGIYKALDSLNLKPDLDTFNLLLDVCRRCGNFELAQRLFKDMADAKLKPDTTTYRHLIGSFLRQTNYEEAFFYLEDMKGKGLKPTYPIYEGLIRRCVSMGDPRYKLAVEELKQMGYEVQFGLQQFIDSGGETKSSRPRGA